MRHIFTGLLISFLYTSHGFSGSVVRGRGDMSEEDKQRMDLKKKYDNEITLNQTLTKQIWPTERKENIEGSKVYLQKLDKDSHQQAFKDCDENMPEINLEKEQLYPGSSLKGSMAGIAHEHQDGFGTCFAHATRNMIISASGGKINPSVFDTALSYKKANRSLMAMEGFNAGHACDAFEAVKKLGYCENKLSPLENGEAPPLIELMTRGKSDAEVLKTYYELEKSSATLSQKTDLLGKSSQLVMNSLDRFLTTETKMNLGDYQKVMTQVEKQLIKHFKTHTGQYINIMKKLPEGAASLPNFTKVFPDIKYAKEKLALSEAQESNLRNQRARFEWQIRKLLAEKKTFADVLSAKKEYFSQFTKLPSGEEVFSDESLKKWWDDLQGKREFLSKNQKAMAFYNELSLLLDGDLQNSLANCSDYQFEAFSVLMRDMQDVVGAMEKNGIASETVLLTELGSLQEPEKLLENLYMPACSQNRQPLPLTQSCLSMDMKSVDSDQKKMNRVLLASLLKNQAIGYDVPRHAMTLVGMKFDKASDKCQYLVRDSSKGGSEWTSPEDFFGSMSKLNILIDPE